MRLLALPALLAAAALVAGPADAAPPSGYSFGRAGGNIRPFTVTISAAGTVKASGPVKVARTHLTAAQLASIGKVAAQAGFSRLPGSIQCARTLPDIASTWIKAGTRTVNIHGVCSAAFTRMWNAVTSAVRLSYG